MRFCQHLSCCTGGRHTKQKTLLLFRSLETNLWQSKKIFYITVYFCASIVVHKKLGSPCHHEYVKENTPTIELLLLGTAKSDLLIIFVTYTLMNFVLIFCCAFRCNISHLLKIVFSFVQYNGIDVNLGADESLLCVLQMTVFYYNISDVSVWSFVVAINKNCKRVSKNNHDLCNISEDLYIISEGDSLRPMLPSDRFGHFMVQWFALVYKVLEGRFVFLNT